MLTSIFLTAALLSVANAHGVIINAQGTAGSPASVGFQVDSALARNCTGISPCQQDTTIIRDAEIAANVVNECGRTELTGNIDVGENTENALAAGAVTKITKGGSVVVTIHQVNADGAGPYTCDLDQTSNSGVISQNLTVTNNVPGVNGLSQAKTTDFNITVTMPTDLACTGASTGNVCTIRCRNNAVAGPFGGCFAVQQTDITAAANSANQLQTAQTLKSVTDQIAVNQADLPVAVAANQQAGAQASDLVAVDQLLGVSVTTKASPVQTLKANIAAGAKAAAGTTTKASAATAATSAAAKKGAKGAANAANGGNKNANRGLSNLKWARRAFSSDSE